ncbi:MAG: hypothetical protein WC498_01125 [Candidatus Saccharimonadales bacterium]
MSLREKWPEFGLHYQDVSNLAPADILKLTHDGNIPNPHERLHYASCAYTASVQEADFHAAADAALRAARLAIQADLPIDVATMWSDRTRDAQVAFSLTGFAIAEIEDEAQEA